jgi:saccharopine dehydrogenase-like NADP-dependent oxidoreductase
MKAIVLGGCGIVGLSLLTYLKEQKEISKILVTDIQEAKLKEEVVWLDDKRFSAKVLDAHDYKALVSTMKGYDVVLNVSDILDKIPIAKAALEAGSNYMDSGFGVEKVRTELDREFRNKGLLAIVNIYFSPGADNILAHYAIERLDKTESVDFRWSVVDIVPASDHSRQLYWGFSFRGIMMHHFTLPSRRLKNGRMIDLPPRAEPEMFTFKGPIGTTWVAGLQGESLEYCHENFPDIPNITFKEALGVEFNERCTCLAGLGFNRMEPIDVDGQMISPAAVLFALADNQPPETQKAPDIRHGGGAIVKGIKDGQKMEYNIQMWPSEKLVEKHKRMGCGKFGGSGGTFRNGSPMGTVAVLMAKGLIKAKGLFLPGLVEPTEEYVNQEVAMGQDVEITKTIRLGDLNDFSEARL